MDKKELQESRMRGYFIDATREMLKGEGLKSVNVRAIADRAGYSYATLYNYFKDLKELVFICVKDFQDEATAIITEKTASIPHGKERIREISKAYISYFIQYPGIFELFFIEKMVGISGKHPTAKIIYTFFDNLVMEDWNHCEASGFISAKESQVKLLALKNLITGSLLMYLNRMHPESYAEFNSHVNQQINLILELEDSSLE